jgi:hypothetical protein
MLASFLSTKKAGDMSDVADLEDFCAFLGRQMAVGKKIPGQYLASDHLVLSLEEGVPCFSEPTTA